MNLINFGVASNIYLRKNFREIDLYAWLFLKISNNYIETTNSLDNYLSFFNSRQTLLLSFLFV